MERQIRVLIVDDSALVRQMLSSMLGADPDIDVVGTASDPYIARDRIKQLNPDVITLDVEMPRMDGLTFLKNLMRLRPLPVVMVSSLTTRGADVTLEALEIGAVDFVTKPSSGLAQEFQDYAEEIANKVKIAAKSQVVAAWSSRNDALAIPPKLAVETVLRKSLAGQFGTTERIVAIGASTGGTEAIKEVLMALPADGPGIVITQHIPEAFSGPFAERLNRMSAMHVCIAQDGAQVLPGHAYVAPGNHHLLLVRDGARYCCALSDGPPVNRHRPSVDVLFRSVAQNAGANAVGVILTGMGDDGARGLAEMRDAGAQTVAQDQKTSVVWGMPGEAVKRNAAQFVMPLPDIADKVLTLVTQRAPAAKTEHGCGSRLQGG